MSDPLAFPPPPWRVTRAEDAIWCAARARRMAESAGLAPKACAGVGIAVGELVTNAVKYAGGGRVTLEVLGAPRPGIRIVVEDSGPGIPDVDLALQDGVSEGHTVLDRPSGKPRRGLGAGLGAVKRLLDEVQIETPPAGGTRITGTKWGRI